jgi:hypothetical protein
MPQGVKFLSPEFIIGSIYKRFVLGQDEYRKVKRKKEEGRRKKEEGKRKN